MKTKDVDFPMPDITFGRYCTLIIHNLEMFSFKFETQNIL